MDGISIIIGLICSVTKFKSLLLAAEGKALVLCEKSGEVYEVKGEGCYRLILHLFKTRLTRAC